MRHLDLPCLWTKHTTNDSQQLKHVTGRHIKEIQQYVQRDHVLATTHCRVLTLSTGIEGHALHKFQNEPIMRNSANLIDTLKATEEKEMYIVLL